MYVDPLLLFSSGQSDHLIFYALFTTSIFCIAAKRQKGNSMNFMNNYNNTNPIIIGIDHGYGNIKTAHCCFKTGVAAYDKEPTFKSNLLVYEGRYCPIRFNGLPVSDERCGQFG